LVAQFNPFLAPKTLLNAGVAFIRAQIGNFREYILGLCYLWFPFYSNEIMYVTSVRIKNIRSIEEIYIEFTSKSRSIVLTGDNGSGKSTILRSIAMGISDEDSAAAVLRELPGELVRQGKDFGEITVDLVQRNGVKFRIITRIDSQKVFEKVRQSVWEYTNTKKRSGYKRIRQEDFPWHTMFSTGYGAGVRNLGTSDYQYYVPIDAMYSLFKYDVPLQNPELAMRRIVAKAKEKGKTNSDEGESYAKDMEKYLAKILLRCLIKKIKNEPNLPLPKTGAEIQFETY
jgi:predicted ATPase